MIKTSFVTTSKKEIENRLRKEFVLASKDETFTKLCNRMKCDEKILMKYTSKLEESTCELKNCSKCKGLNNCINSVSGHVYYPVFRKDYLEFIYKPCKYFKENNKLNNTVFFETPSVLMNASLSDLISEKERNSILKYINDFL